MRIIKQQFQEHAQQLDQMSELKTAVIGAGAIGGLSAAFLQEAGQTVEVICNHEDVAEKLRNEGLRYSGLKGEGHVRLQAVHGAENLSFTPDVVLLATKATECEAAAQDLAVFLGPDSLVVSLQNGICEYRLADILGPKRVVGCVVGWSATMHNPTEMVFTAGGEFVIGYMDREADKRLLDLRQLLHTIVPTRVSRTILADLYSKLVLNACMNFTAVIAGLQLNDLLQRKAGRDVFIAVMREAIAVADAEGIRVPAAGRGKLDYYRFLDSAHPLAALKRHLLLRFVGRKNKAVKLSSLQSVERGRKTEVDFINGYISQLGQKHGIPTPVSDGIVRMVHDIEEMRLEMSPSNLRALLD